MSAPAQIPGQPQPKAPRRRPRDQGRTVVLLILAVLITLFAVLNIHDVRVHFIFGTREAPLIIVIVASLLVGMVLGYFASRRSGRGRDGKGQSGKAR
jgi:uncharacterized integral membrane protein